MCATLAGLPVRKLSRQTTSVPAASSASQRWLPRNPAPPVTTARAGRRTPPVPGPVRGWSTFCCMGPPRRRRLLAPLPYAGGVPPRRAGQPAGRLPGPWPAEPGPAAQEPDRGGPDPLHLLAGRPGDPLRRFGLLHRRPQRGAGPVGRLPGSLPRTFALRHLLLGLLCALPRPPGTGRSSRGGPLGGAQRGLRLRELPLVLAAPFLLLRVHPFRRPRGPRRPLPRPTPRPAPRVRPLVRPLVGRRAGDRVQVARGRRRGVDRSEAAVGQAMGEAPRPYGGCRVLVGDGGPQGLLDLLAHRRADRSCGQGRRPADEVGQHLLPLPAEGPHLRPRQDALRLPHPRPELDQPPDRVRRPAWPGS